MPQNMVCEVQKSGANYFRILLSRMIQTVTNAFLHAAEIPDRCCIKMCVCMYVCMYA